MWAIVEQVVDNNLYIVFDDQSKGIIKNTTGIKIVENNYIHIVDNKIVEIKEYNEKLYKEIKKLEKKVLKRKSKL